MDTIESSEPFLEPKTALKDEEQSDSIDPSVSAAPELPPTLRFLILHSKQLLARFAPFFLCTIQFLWVLSFYLLNNMEKEKDMIMANIKFLTDWTWQLLKCFLQLFTRKEFVWECGKQMANWGYGEGIEVTAISKMLIIAINLGQ